MGGDDEYDYYPEPEEKVADDEDDELDDEDAPAEDLADKSIEDVLKDLRSKQELRSKQAAAPRSDGDEGSEEEKDKESKERASTHQDATAGPATDYQRLDLKNAKASRRFLTSSRGLIRRGSSSVPLYTGDPPPTMAPGAAGAMHVRGRDQMVSASFEGTGSDRDIMQLQGSQAGRAVHEDVRVPAAKMRKVDKMNVDRTKGANKQEYTNGEKALALTDDGAWRMGRVTQCHRGGEYDIRYDDGPGAAHTSAKTVKAKSVGRMFTHLPDVALLVGDESDDDEDEFDERTGRVIHPSERISAEFLLCGDVVVSSPRRRRRHGPRKIWLHATLQFTKLRISHFSVAQRAHLQHRAEDLVPVALHARLHAGEDRRPEPVAVGVPVNRRAAPVERHGPGGLRLRGAEERAPVRARVREHRAGRCRRTCRPCWQAGDGKSRRSSRRRPGGTGGRPAT